MIGVFDSGLGGLTVLRELVSRFKHADFVYLADHAHVACHVPDRVRLADVVRMWKARVTRAWSGAPTSPFEGGYFDRFCRNRQQADRLLRYIEYNPVEAGLVRTPMDWRWSSAWWKAQGLWTPDWSRLPVFPS